MLRSGGPTTPELMDDQNQRSSSQSAPSRSAAAESGGHAAATSTPAFAMGDVIYAACGLAPLSWLLQFGTAYAFAHFTLSGRTRRAVGRNIAAITGDDPSSATVRRLVWQAIKTHHVRNVQLLLAPRTVPRLRQLLPIEGRGHLDAALAQGRGAILMGAHINSVVELMGVMALRELGYDVRTALPGEGARFAPTKARAIVNRLTNTAAFAELTGAMFAQFNVRPIVNALAAKQIVFMMGDGWHSASFVDVQFAGRTVPITTGALSVAALCGAPVVPMFAVGTAPDRLRIVLEPAFSVEKGSPNTDLAQKAQLFATQVERHVRANLSAWQHCFVEDVFGSMASWRDRSLRDRYSIQT